MLAGYYFNETLKTYKSIGVIYTGGAGGMSTPLFEKANFVPLLFESRNFKKMFLKNSLH